MNDDLRGILLILFILVSSAGLGQWFQYNTSCEDNDNVPGS